MRSRFDMGCQNGHFEIREEKVFNPAKRDTLLPLKLIRFQYMSKTLINQEDALDNKILQPVTAGVNKARLTVLRSRGIKLTKTYRLTDKGIEVTPYGNAKHFDVSPFDFSSIPELTSIFNELVKNDDVSVINAKSDQILDGVRRTLENFQEPSEGVRWIVLDFDHIDLGVAVDLNSIAAIEMLIKRLPPEFHNVDYFYQFSNSAGILNPDGSPLKSGINVHLFFMFQVPIPLKQLKSYLKEFCMNTGFTVMQNEKAVPAIDMSAFSPVQPIYTSLPDIGEGVECQTFADGRQGNVEKDHGVVALPPEAYQATEKAPKETKPVQPKSHKLGWSSFPAHLVALFMYLKCLFADHGNYFSLCHPHEKTPGGWAVYADNPYWVVHANHEHMSLTDWLKIYYDFDTDDYNQWMRDYGQETGTQLNQQPVADLPEFALSDAGNAERLGYYFGSDLRYCEETKSWVIWNGKQWKFNSTGKVMKYALSVVRGIIRNEANREIEPEKRNRIIQHAKRSESRRALEAMVALAIDDFGIKASEFDSNDWLLNLQNGTVNLKTGALQEHRREDYITKILPYHYDASAKARRWIKFLMEIFNNDFELISFLQKVTGYWATGLTIEQCIFIMHGMGKNGKSTFCNLLIELFGCYYEKVGIHALMTKNKAVGGLSPEIAKLNGARLVIGSEIGKGMYLDESLIKDITGNDDIEARKLYQNPVTFKPTFKVLLYGNYKPQIIGTDYGILRRLMFFPFNVIFQNPDKTLFEKLVQELPGILNWAIEGCLSWQQEGLQMPQSMLQALDEYKIDSDPIGRFLNDKCDIAPTPSETIQYRVGVNELMGNYWAWCNEAAEHPMSNKDFSEALKEKGIRKIKSSHYFFQGIRLKLTV
jgi:P4 family phage/plasmid primase-like protien